MTKNVLINGKIYTKLITDYGLTEEELMPVPILRIHSPKTIRFIRVDGKAYKELLAIYSADDLYKRRDGYIISPSSKKTVKIMSKTFKELLENYTMDELFALPRVDKRGKFIIEKKESTSEESSDTSEKKEKKKEKKNDTSEKKSEKKEKNEKVAEKEKSEKKEKNEKVVEKKEKKVVNKQDEKENKKKDKYNKMIKKNVIFYIEARNIEKNETNEYECNYHCGVVFTDGILSNLYEAIEHKLVDETFEYKMENRIEEIKDYDTMMKFLYEHNEEFLHDMKVVGVDLFHHDDWKKILNKKYKHAIKCDDYEALVKHHIWFGTQANVISKKEKKRFVLSCTADDKKIKMYKEGLLKDIKQSYKIINEYFENKC